MIISDMSELNAYLTAAQDAGEMEIRCECTPAFAAQVKDAVLIETLVTGLSKAQGVQHRIVRSRGKGMILTTKIRYRDGVRLLSGQALTKAEAEVLELAKDIVQDMRTMADEEASFQALYAWVCGQISYVHTAPGQKGYERLVGAVGVLQERQANCQGYADVLYLLCSLCGIACAYRCGHGTKRLHVWNAVRLNGVWHEVDASKGARNMAHKTPLQASLGRDD